MALQKVASAAAVAGFVAVALSSPLLAQTDIQAEVTAPDYASGAATGSMSDGHFNTPESDGRPGVKFFTLGVQAFRKGDYAHAVDMYKIAASWAYKPAEYNLGVMYFKGQGVPVNRPLGAAWMVLAAERGDPQYVKARDMMVTLLSNAEFAQTDEYWGQLTRTFGDKVALRRAKAQWAWVRTHQTGTRVGGAVGELLVGGYDTGGAPVEAGKSGKAQMFAAGFGYMQGGSVDGSIAYRQLRQSDNPYDQVFLKNRTGTVKVEPLVPLKHGKDKQPAKQGGGQSSSPDAQRLI